MSRFLEAFFSLFINAALFFDGLKARRNDDPILADYKAKQWAVIRSVVFIFVVLLVGWAAGTLLGVLDGFKGAQMPVASAREWISTAFAVAVAATVAYAGYAGWSLFRFVREQNPE
jgi:hypothetical protein